jgi:hypothetical protein
MLVLPPAKDSQILPSLSGREADGAEQRRPKGAKNIRKTFAALRFSNFFVICQ